MRNPDSASIAIEAIRELGGDIGNPTMLREADVVNENLDFIANDAAKTH